MVIVVTGDPFEIDERGKRRRSIIMSRNGIAILLLFYWGLLHRFSSFEILDFDVSRKPYGRGRGGGGVCCSGNG